MSRATHASDAAGEQAGETTLIGVVHRVEVRVADVRLSHEEEPVSMDEKKNRESKVLTSSCTATVAISFLNGCASTPYAHPRLK